AGKRPDRRCGLLPRKPDHGTFALLLLGRVLVVLLPPATGRAGPNRVRGRGVRSCAGSASAPGLAGTRAVARDARHAAGHRTPDDRAEKPDPGHDGEPCERGSDGRADRAAEPAG